MSGERVPSTRQVASLLEVSRNTALLAYEQLLAEGFITPRSGAAGTVVAPVLPPDGYVARPTRRPGSTRPGRPGAAPTLAAVGDRYVKSARACAHDLGMPSLTWELAPPTIRYDFRPGRASFGDLPYALWRRLLSARARDAKVVDLEYGPPAGRRELREAISARLRRLRTPWRTSHIDRRQPQASVRRRGVPGAWSPPPPRLRRASAGVSSAGRRTRQAGERVRPLCRPHLIAE